MKATQTAAATETTICETMFCVARTVRRVKRESGEGIGGRPRLFLASSRPAVWGRTSSDCRTPHGEVAAGRRRCSGATPDHPHSTFRLQARSGKSPDTCPMPRPSVPKSPPPSSPRKTSASSRRCASPTLGKKGSISELLKGLGDMSPEERKTAGAELNELRDDGRAEHRGAPQQCSPNWRWKRG